MPKTQKLRRPDSDNDSHWGGWTRSAQHLPIDIIEKHGYILELREDFKGKYWQIIKSTK